MNKKEVKQVEPTNLGWLEYKLNTQEMDYVWRCIKNKKENTSKTLAGNITSSYSLLDRGDWFFTNVCYPLICEYGGRFGNLGSSAPIRTGHPYCLNRWWVNYQKQNEFNPIHNHGGVYSFVIWMKIPYDSKKQNQKNIARNSNSPLISDFQFLYSDMLGRKSTHEYHLSSEYEGMMLFFPAKLDHQVYPFYDCDEDRISVSGNILIDTSKKG
tara:strand:- start:24 stop:659 length:636 start_codon:yes stop_codon:yes gene_type:complete